MKTNNVMTERETQRMLLRRIDSLQFSASESEGKWTYWVRTNAYIVLETHQSRIGALWSYARWIVREWKRNIVCDVNWYRRLWWCRYVRRMSEDQVADMLDAEDMDFYRKYTPMLKRIVEEEEERR